MNSNSNLHSIDDVQPTQVSALAPTKTEEIPECRFVFFGTSELSVIVLKKLQSVGLIPSAIITTPDKPKGRKLVLTPPDSKVFGMEHNIPVLQFAKLDEDAIAEIKKIECDFYLVASYGLIIPQSILDIPKLGVLNIHPSLLPMYRGASPIQQAILDDRHATGITIMKMDAKMDHGPILYQAKRQNQLDWPKTYTELEHELAIQATNALLHILPSFLKKQIIEIEQNHGDATFTKKIQKVDGLIDTEKLTGEIGRAQFLKFCAYEVWPTTYFIIKKQGVDTRIKITKAHWDRESASMMIDRVIPEGQKETDYGDFLERVKLYY